MSAGPLIISREGLQLLAEGVTEAANHPERARVIDPFLELKDCAWCHRRVGGDNLRLIELSTLGVGGAGQRLPDEESC